MSTDTLSATMSQQNGCHLARLPLELLQRVSWYIDTPSLFALRMTSKVIETSLFNLFSREFFSIKQFMISDFSLQTLVDISKHKLLSSRLKHVIIGLDHYERQPGATIHLTTEQLLEYRSGYSEQQSLLATDRAQKLLVETFRNLTNLETIDIRDFSSTRRSRDGSGASWNSYGALTVERKTGQRLSQTGGHLRDGISLGEYVSQVFALILASLAEAGAQPSKLEVICRNRSWGLIDYAFLVPPALEPSYDFVLAGIKTLNLDIFPACGMDFGRLTHPDEMNISTVLLKKFLQKTTGVTALRLNFQHAQHQCAEKLLEWIGRPSPESDEPLIPGLLKLNLGFVEVTSDTLISVYNKFPLLESLELWKVLLYDTTARDVKVNGWRGIVEHLSRTESLKHVNLGFLKQHKADGSQLPVLLVKPAPAGDKAATDSRHRTRSFADSLQEQFRGSVVGTREWLKAKASSMHIEWPSEVGRDDEDSDGDSEVDDEDEDEDEDGDGDGDGQDD